jgi:hypothetical protein
MMLAHWNRALIADGAKLIGADPPWGNWIWCVDWLWAYVVGLSVAVHFYGAWCLHDRIERVLARLRNMIEFAAGLTLSIYLFHFPIMTMASAALNQWPHGPVRSIVTIVATVIWRCSRPYFRAPAISLAVFNYAGDEAIGSHNGLDGTRLKHHAATVRYLPHAASGRKICPPQRAQDARERACGAALRLGSAFAAQCIDLPPSTLMVWPVMKSLAGEDKNITAPTRSAGTWTRSMARPATREAR